MFFRIPCVSSVLSTMSEAVTISTLIARIRPDLWLRLGIAAVLGTAAVLKTIELSTSPVVQEGWLHSRVLGTLAVNVELLVVCLLASGVLPKLTWLGTTAMFVVFSVVSGYLFLTGAESCNCFGRVLVSPVYTMVFDLAVVGSLSFSMLFWPIGWNELRNEFFGLIKRIPHVAVIWLCLALPATYTILSVQKNELAELGTEFIGVDGRKTILLEPEKWVGKKFPLLPYIEPPEVREKLKTGEWVLTLYHNGCSECQEVINLLNNVHFGNFVFIDIFPYANEKGQIQAGWLKKGLVWFAKVPTVVHIIDGNVRRTEARFGQEAS